MLYTWDWSREFADYDAGRVPAHRLFGAAHLPTEGVEISICRWRFVPERLRHRQLWKIYQAVWSAVTQRRVDCVIATTEASALPVLALSALRLLRRPVLVFAVGALTDKFIDGQVGGLRRILIRKAHRIVVFSSVQVESTSRLLGVPSVRVVFTPFGVDLEFLARHARPKRWDVVAAGTNEGKDYPTLLRALQPGETCLIVTDARNAAEIASTPTKVGSKSLRTSRSQTSSTDTPRLAEW